jgi:hypothetical protein
VQDEQAGSVELALELPDLLITAKEQGGVLRLEVVEEFIRADGASSLFGALIPRPEHVLRRGASTLRLSGWQRLAGGLQFHLGVRRGGPAQQVEELAQSLDVLRTLGPRGMVGAQLLPTLCRQEARPALLGAVEQKDVEHTGHGEFLGTGEKRVQKQAAAGRRGRQQHQATFAQVHVRFPALALEDAEAALHLHQIVAEVAHRRAVMAHLDALHKVQGIGLEKPQALQKLFQAVRAYGDFFRDLGIRDAGMMKLVAQGDERLNGLLHDGLLGESGAAPWLKIDFEQLGHDQQVTLGVVLLQEVAQEPVPFTERGIPQVVPQLQPPLTQGWSLLVCQVVVQLRQHHQGQELHRSLSRLDKAF